MTEAAGSDLTRYVRIESITDHLDLVEVIARWHWEEWGHADSEGSLATWTAGLRQRTNRETIPTTYVALAGDELLGSVTLVEHDMATRRELSPWLAGLYVAPAFRGRGVGSALTRHAVMQAAKMGVPRLYLHTTTARGLYERLGWRAIAEESYEGESVAVMIIETSRSRQEVVVAQLASHAMTDRRVDDRTRIIVEPQPSGASEVLLALGGQQISRVVIMPMLMRIGAAVVRVDGIAGVRTDEAFRNRGYLRRVMTAALEQMHAGDAALSLLFGIPDLYQRFGYETVGPEYRVVAPSQMAKGTQRSLPPGWHFRPLTGDDLPAVMRLYHVNTRRATGALVRHDAGDDPAETEWLVQCDPHARTIGLRAWDRLRTVAAAPGEDACRVLLDPSGTIAAYAWRGANQRNWWMNVRRRHYPQAFHLAEPMARDPVAADVLLAACRMWAAEAGEVYDVVALAIPPDGLLAWAAAYQGGQHFSAFSRGGDFMGRVIDLERLVAQLIPELSVRVRATSWRSSGRLTFVTEEGEASLVITPDGATTDQVQAEQQWTVALPQAMLARLCLGGFDTDDMLARLPTKPDAETATVLQMLFPRRFPHIYPVDRF